MENQIYTKLHDMYKENERVTYFRSDHVRQAGHIWRSRSKQEEYLLQWKADNIGADED